MSQYLSNNAQSPVLFLHNYVFLLLNAMEYLSFNFNKQLTAQLRMTKENNERRFVSCESINLNKKTSGYNYYRKSAESYTLAIKWPWYKQLMITVLIQRWIIAKVILILTYVHDFLYSLSQEILWYDLSIRVASYIDPAISGNTKDEVHV